MTVRSVAAAAGCSTTGVYTWFGGKNGLVEAIFVDGFERFGAAVRVAGDAAPGPERVRARALAYRTWALANPTHYTVMFGHAVPDFEPSPAASLAAQRTFTDLVVSVTAAIDHGDLAGEPFEIAHHLWAGIHGYVSLEIAGMGLTPEPERPAAFVAGVERLLRGCRP